MRRARPCWYEKSTATNKTLMTYNKLLLAPASPSIRIKGENSTEAENGRKEKDWSD